MEAVVIARILALAQVLAVLGLLMAGLTLVLNRKVESGSVAATVTKAVLLTLCAVLVDGVTFLRRPAFADAPEIWVSAICSTLGALLGWLNVWEARRNKARSGKIRERSLH